jgi:hypothetical protein
MSQFDKLLDELDAIRQGRADARELIARARGDTKTGVEFRKSLAAITDELTVLAPKPRRTIIVARKDAPSAGAETVAKAFSLLQHGDLNADQRGRLMLSLGNLAEGVAARQATFAKAHPMIGHIDNVIARLDAAHADNYAEIAAPFLEDAEELLASGKLTQADHSRLTVHLRLIKDRIKDHDRAKKA